MKTLTFQSDRPVRLRPLNSNDREVYERLQSMLEPGDRWEMKKAGAEHLTRFRFVHTLIHPEDDVVVGLVIGRLKRMGSLTVLGFKRLIILPEFRRQGFGRSALSFFHQMEPSISLIFPVRESNLTGQLFLKALGFRWIESFPNFYHQPNEGCYLFRFDPTTQ